MPNNHLSGVMQPCVPYIWRLRLGGKGAMSLNKHIDLNLAMVESHSMLRCSHGRVVAIVREHAFADSQISRRPAECHCRACQLPETLAAQLSGAV
jgi:hypothetical protein